MGRAQNSNSVVPQEQDNNLKGGKGEGPERVLCRYPGAHGVDDWLVPDILIATISPYACRTTDNNRTYLHKLVQR
jgi:hypothetical protein